MRCHEPGGNLREQSADEIKAQKTAADSSPSEIEAQQTVTASKPSQSEAQKPVTISNGWWFKFKRETLQ